MAGADTLYTGELSLATSLNGELDLHRDFDSCSKNPGHKNFIPVKQFSIGHLPENYRTPCVLAWIKHSADLAVKLSVKYVSPNRPDDYILSDQRGKDVLSTGSGFVLSVNGIRTDQDGQNNCVACGVPADVCGYFTVITAAHVVFDDSEAEKTEIEFFYDDPRDKSGVRKAHGVKILTSNVDGDFSVLQCVTHDEELWEKLTHLCTHRGFIDKLKYITQKHWKYFLHKIHNNMSNSSRDLAIHISHPHGQSKMVTVGIRLDGTTESGYYQHNYTADTCKGGSGGPVWILPEKSYDIFDISDFLNKFSLLYGVPHHSCSGNNINSSCSYTFYVPFEEELRLMGPNAEAREQLTYIRKALFQAKFIKAYYGDEQDEHSFYKNSTQDSGRQDRWLQEIRESQGKYEQEVKFGHVADLYKCFNSCTKNPGHVQFIDVNTFRSEHLPECYRNDQMLFDLVRVQADVTCLIKVSYVSPDRPQTSPFYKYRGRSDFSRSGTGWVSHVIVYTDQGKGNNWQYRPCGCQTCQRSSEPRSEWAEVWIYTASHVLFDKSEAEACKCYFFYDNAQEKLTDCPVLTHTHVHEVWIDCDNDVSETRYYSHDLVLARKLKDMCDRYRSRRMDLSMKYATVRHVPGRVSEEKDNDMNSDVEEDVTNLIDSSDDANDDDQVRIPEHDLVIITSHPHGCSKMVTLGHVTHRYPKLYRYNSYEYSTATCPGSSGAPVFIEGSEFGWNSHPHSRHVRGQGPQQINRCGVCLD